MFDVFLGGPWEQYSSEPYKSLLKAAFPAMSFYDPEATQAGDWFERNLEALRKSKILVVFVPAFPFPGVGPEVGIYFEHRTLMGREPLIVAVWPEAVQPQWGKEVLARMGTVVPTVHEAIGVIRGLLEGGDDTPTDSGRDGVQGRGHPPLQ